MKNRLSYINFGIACFLFVAVAIGAEFYPFRSRRPGNRELIVSLSKKVLMPQEDLEIDINLSDKDNFIYFNAHIYRDNKQIFDLNYGKNDLCLDEPGNYIVRVSLIDSDHKLHTLRETFVIQAGGGNQSDIGDDLNPPQIFIENEEIFNNQSIFTGRGIYLDINCSDNVSASENISLTVESNIGQIKYDKFGRMYFISDSAGDAIINIIARDEAGNIAQKSLTIHIDTHNTYQSFLSKWVELQDAMPQKSIIYGFNSIYFDGRGTQNDGVAYKTGYGQIFYDSEAWEFTINISSIEKLDDGYIQFDLFDKKIVITGNLIMAFNQNAQIAQYYIDDTIEIKILHDGNRNLKLSVDDIEPIDIGAKPYENDFMLSFYNVETLIEFKFSE